MSHHLYSDAYEGLPVTAPIGFPHLITLGPHVGDPMLYRELHIADGVATMLYHYNPDVLTKFLDMSIAEVSFARKNRVEGELWIKRTDRDILVSRVATWHGPVRYFSPWTLEMEMGFKVDEETGVWKTSFVGGPCVSNHLRVGLEAIGPSELYGGQLAHCIIGHEFWKTGPEIEFSVNIRSAPAT